MTCHNLATALGACCCCKVLLLTGAACYLCCQVDEVKTIMSDNIEKVLSRGEKLDLLVDKTDNLMFEVCWTAASSNSSGGSAGRGSRGSAAIQFSLVRQAAGRRPGWPGTAPGQQQCTKHKLGVMQQVLCSCAAACAFSRVCAVAGHTLLACACRPTAL